MNFHILHLVVFLFCSFSVVSQDRTEYDRALPLTLFLSSEIGPTNLMGNELLNSKLNSGWLTDQMSAFDLSRIDDAVFYLNKLDMRRDTDPIFINEKFDFSMSRPIEAGLNILSHFMSQHFVRLNNR